MFFVVIMTSVVSLSSFPDLYLLIININILDDFYGPQCKCARVDCDEQLEALRKIRKRR